MTYNNRKFLSFRTKVSVKTSGTETGKKTSIACLTTFLKAVFRLHPGCIAVKKPRKVTMCRSETLKTGKPYAIIS